MSERELYERLRDACLNGNASETERKKFSALLAKSDDFVDDYLEHAQIDATLAWYGQSEDIPPLNQVSPVTQSRTATDKWLLIGVAATLFAVVSGWIYSSVQANAAKSVAYLESAAHCQWGVCTIPTSLQTDLPAGRLRLISGVAKLRFPNVTVTLEGPVDLEILNTKACRVYSGRVIGQVDPGGEGFVVETPNAAVVDRGTKFGVAVKGNGDAQLDVIDGVVDIRHHATGQKIRAKGASSVKVDGQQLQVIDQNYLQLQATEERPNKSRFEYISSSDGEGEELFLTYGDRLEGNEFPRPLHTLLVKHSESQPHWERVIVLRFDLSTLSKDQIKSAHLRLDGVATEMGYASLVPDASLEFYVLDEQFERAWDSESSKWASFPGTVSNAPIINQDHVNLIGEIVIPQSQPEGRFIMNDQRLADALRSDRDGLITIVLKRATSGTGGPSYVHGFADRTHPTATPPTLRIEMESPSNE
ncbi:iron dicitrate transport regulator FecR [Roseiconus lacunae]|uniref:iron dicitrate transport regulator FecR n=1 Tax=Roseiconus lacunae TaxID=2605694 RepID=UPI001E5D6530|nr:iron dicitrate transport regulator FecR [Roseiconus lacunae]MCD0462875.1 iron dicitrate transport regulator FecR [Roseiconus lacunae]